MAQPIDGATAGAATRQYGRRVLKYVLVGFAVLAVCGVALAFWLRQALVFPELGFQHAFDHVGEPELQQHAGTGSMPLSTLITQCVHRLHDATHLWRGRDFPRTFEDGPWKWTEGQRYAPPNLVAGHYFALDAAGAEAEARHYKIKPRTRVRLEVDVDLDNVLDLRFEPNVRVALADVLEDGSGSLMWFLRALVHEETGGNVLTDDIGTWAQQSGYNGIVFFGARSIARYRTSLDSGDMQLGMPVVADIFHELRADPAAANVVAFGGVELVRSIRRFRVDGGAWEANPYFGATEDTVDAVLVHTSVDRRERVDGIFRLSTSRSLKFEWDGKVTESTEPDEPDAPTQDPGEAQP